MGLIGGRSTDDIWLLGVRPGVRLGPLRSGEPGRLSRGVLAPRGDRVMIGEPVILVGYGGCRKAPVIPFPMSFRGKRRGGTVG